MSHTKWWLRIVGVFYVLQFVAMAVVRAPIRAQGPEGALARDAAGDPIAMFLVDSWVAFGLEVGAIGVAILIASRRAEQARALIWTIVAIELGRGIVADLYMIARGNKLPVLVVWLAIHTLVIVSGLFCLRRARSPEAPIAAMRAA